MNLAFRFQTSFDLDHNCGIFLGYHNLNQRHAKCGPRTPSSPSILQCGRRSNFRNTKEKDAKFGILLFYLHSYENIFQSHAALVTIQYTVLFVTK
jgi:hypothetical protein